jgi:hypothetical protein
MKPPQAMMTILQMDVSECSRNLLAILQSILQSRVDIIGISIYDSRRLKLERDQASA